MKKKLLLLAPALLSMVITGCGTGGDTNPAPEPTPANPGGDPNTPTSDPVTPSYLITFKDENGATLDSKKWDKGSTPSYNYSKADTAEWDYTVEGWSTTQDGDPITIPTVTQEATYYALVSKVKKQYTITFDSHEGSSVNSITEGYGTSVAKPTNPTRSGKKFVGWSLNSDGSSKISWPYTLTGDVTLHANWNDTINLNDALVSLLSAIGERPDSYIPNKMKTSNTANYVTASQVDYDFESGFTDVDDITYGGFGEQWHMVTDNLKESNRFYDVLTTGEVAIALSASAISAMINDNPSEDDTYEVEEAAYTSSLVYSNGILAYSLQLKEGVDVPLFGEVLPKYEAYYDIANNVKEVRIQISNNNAMRYLVSHNHYVFALEYGIETVSRKAYFEVSRDSMNNTSEGHIYEFIQYKDKDLAASCADFYIDDTYVSVVGNKASGMPGFSGYINELYLKNEGKLLGCEVRETFEKWNVNKTYHTLWFNLDNITGITNVKAVENGSHTYGLGGENPHDVYVNNKSTVFKPTYNKVVLVKTSRKYDIELRKQYFYGLDGDNKLVEYEVSIPMMFIQADHDSYTNFTDFPADMLDDNNITASVNLSSTYLAKIQSDYASLIDAFIEHKDSVTSSTIENFIK